MEGVVCSHITHTLLSFLFRDCGLMYMLHPYRMHLPRSSHLSPPYSDDPLEWVVVKCMDGPVAGRGFRWDSAALAVLLQPILWRHAAKPSISRNSVV